MAVIQKIRDKYAKLAGGIIAVALVGFLLMDAGDNIRKIFSGSEYVAKVNGEKISPKEYAVRINEYETLYEVMGNKIDDNTRAQIHSQVLNEMVYEKLIEDQMDDLGITITKEEEKEMISGANPDQMVMQFPYFKNPETGQFDPQYLMAFEKNQLPKTAEAQKAYDAWQMMKAYIKRTRLIQKYNSLFAGSVYTPKFITDLTTKDQNYLASVNYVKIPYSSVNDNDVKVTDADLKAYMEKHKAQYTQKEPVRAIEYVSFDAKPSSDDTARVLSSLTKIKSDFINDKDPESFVNRNSDDQYKGNFVTKKSFMSAYSDSIMKLPVGEVYGPYFENGSYKLTKVLEKNTLPDSVKLRHILIKTEDKRNAVLADSSAKNRIDSIAAAIKAGASFKDLVDKYSDDKGSKTTAGEYTFTLEQRPQLSKEFGDFIFDGKTGEKKIVKVDNDNYSGYHYIEILDQRATQPAAKLATVSKALDASEETINNAFAKANEFAGKNTTAAAFDETVKKNVLNKMQAQNIKLNDFVIPGLGTSREIFRWIFDAKVGDISPVFSLDGRYVIAKLTGIQDKGLMPLDDNNRPAIEAQVKSEKKGDMIADKYKAMTSLDAISKAAAQPLDKVDSFNAGSSYLLKIGYEPKIVGYAFYEGYKLNTMSPAIKGYDGVYFMNLTFREHNKTVTQNPMFQQQQMMQEQQMKNSIISTLQDDLRKNATIDYSEKNLY